jgi:hypothetical protein
MISYEIFKLESQYNMNKINKDIGKYKNILHSHIDTNNGFQSVPNLVDQT